MRSPPPLVPPPAAAPTGLALATAGRADDGEGLTGEFRVPPPRRPGGWLRWGGIIAGAWALYGLLFAQQAALLLALDPREPDRAPAELLPWTFSSALFWAVLTPGVAWLARRLRLTRRRWLRRLPLHLAAALAIAGADAAWDTLVRPHVTPFPRGSLAVSFLTQVDENVLLYFVIVLVAHAFDFYRLYRERRVHAAQLEAELARAQLDLLKMQLQPHFLFNTLHAIAELVHEEPDTADRMLTRLGDFLRLSLDHSGRQEVPLRRELEFLQAYLEIELTRFRDRLTVRTCVEPRALDALVPNLILQPLVENALRHGIAARARSGVLEILARCRGDELLELEVRDNGSGLAAPPNVIPEGVGLRNTRTRLRQLYGAAHQLTLRDRTGGGVVATLVVPLRLAGGTSAVPVGTAAAETAATGAA